MKELFLLKAKERIPDTFLNERNKALKKAELDHPGQPALDFLEDYAPWWASREVWRGMCRNWKSEGHIKKSQAYSQNRRSGVSPGEKAKGTWRGGTRSQSIWQDQLVMILTLAVF